MATNNEFLKNPRSRRAFIKGVAGAAALVAVVIVGRHADKGRPTSSSPVETKTPFAAGSSCETPTPSITAEARTIFMGNSGFPQAIEPTAAGTPFQQDTDVVSQTPTASC